MPIIVLKKLTNQIYVELLVTNAINKVITLISVLIRLSINKEIIFGRVGTDKVQRGGKEAGKKGTGSTKNDKINKILFVNIDNII